MLTILSFVYEKKNYKFVCCFCFFFAFVVLFLYIKYMFLITLSDYSKRIIRLLQMASTYWYSTATIRKQRATTPRFRISLNARIHSLVSHYAWKNWWLYNIIYKSDFKIINCYNILYEYRKDMICYVMNIFGGLYVSKKI
jgi:hypothetical protein